MMKPETRQVLRDLLTLLDKDPTLRLAVRDSADRLIPADKRQALLELVGNGFGPAALSSLGLTVGQEQFHHEAGRQKRVEAKGNIKGAIDEFEAE